MPCPSLPLARRPPQPSPPCPAPLPSRPRIIATGFTERASILAIYYDACWASAEALMGVKNQPRCINGTPVHRKIDAAMMEMHSAAERTAEHVLKREPDDEREAYCRQRILLHWYSNLDDPAGEVALARHLIAFHGKEA
jgi:hypothetical protein